MEMKMKCMIAMLLAAGTLALAEPPQMPRYRFENFTTANGLPDNHVYSVLVDGDRIWAGTENGLAVYENHAWKTYTTKDGLAHRAVLSLALDKRTGDVWAGTMGGLSRVSGGRIDSYSQLNSGLSNDVVYGVSVEGENVWVATAAGACRLDLHTNQWTLYNERNTPMIEIWVSTMPCGAAAFSSTTRKPVAGISTTIPTAKPKWCSSRIRG
jgi:ligand-binding sensor domain-containing protein